VIGGEITRLALRQTIRSAIVWGAIVLVLWASTAQGYQNLYPDAARRLKFAASIGSNNGFAALLGVPRHLETTGGFLSWRIGVVVAVMLSLWGMLTATKLLRGEEDAGRWETLAVAPLTAPALTAAVLVAIVVAALVPFAGAVLGALLTSSSAHLGIADAVWLALAWTLCALAFASFGAFAAQCFAPRSRATLATSVVLAAAYILRMIGDAEPRFGWVRWTTPFGWVEEAHIYGGTRPLVLGLLVIWIVVFGAAAVRLAGRRDMGAAFFGAEHRVRAARRWRLGNPLTDALRFVRGTTIGWLTAAVAMAFVLGLLAPGAARAIAESDLEHQFGGVLGKIGTPTGYLGATFVIAIAALISLSPSGHVTNARDEEASGRLDTYLAGLVSRRRWLWSRIAVAAGGACAMAAGAAAAGWLGQAITGGDVSFVKLLEAAACYVPLALVFGGIGIAVFGVAPRATRGLVATLVGVAVLVEVVGAVLNAPDWMLDLSPFSHLGTAPAEPARVAPALLMLAISVLLMVFGVEMFARRDLIGE
jgi:ABC-2 type transport system permease protein